MLYRICNLIFDLHKRQQMGKNKDISAQSYKNLVNDFARRRKKREKHQQYIEKVTHTGGGRISNFESHQYSPRLNTFVKWCWAAGIEIKLVNVMRAPNLDKIMAKNADPGRIIDEIIEQQTKKA